MTCSDTKEEARPAARGRRRRRRILGVRNLATAAAARGRRRRAEDGDCGADLGGGEHGSRRGQRREALRRPYSTRYTITTISILPLMNSDRCSNSDMQVLSGCFFLRGHVYMMSANVSDFLTPPPHVHFHATSLTKLPYCICFWVTPPPSLC